MSSSIRSATSWQSTRLPKFESLKRNQKFDVVVIGGGITGVTAAYLLQQAGKQVALVERNRLGSVDTGLTTAHLTAMTDLRLSTLVKRFGKVAAAAVWSAGETSVDLIEHHVLELGIDCDFRRVPGYLQSSIDGTKDESRNLKREAELAREIGANTCFVEETPYFCKPAIRVANQAKFHPFKYLAALAESAVRSGCAIFEQSEVTEVRDDPLTVVANEHELQCDDLVIATHVPLMGKSGTLSSALFQAKLFPFTSYVIGAKLPHNLLPEACFWDTSDPYYYWRIDRHKTNDYVIFGGLDHKTGQIDDTEKRFDELEAKIKQLLPTAQCDRKWSGKVIETDDGLPFIGETTSHQFVGTGFSGNGMTFGTLTAMMACDSIQNVENPWQSLFAPSRKKIAGGWRLLKEHLDYPYYFLKDRLRGPEKKDPQDVAPAEGAILRLDGQPVACYRNEQGKAVFLAAECTHLGCLVHWNSAESTWDCPCHGSRFRATGEVMAGPAESPLEPISNPPKDVPVKSTSVRKKKPARPNSSDPKKGHRASAPRSH